jgi:hypothetical protein
VRAAVEQLQAERRRARPPRRRAEARLASRLRQDTALLARAFFRCWAARGLDEAVGLCRLHGVERLRGLGIEQLARATSALEGAAAIWRVRGL